METKILENTELISQRVTLQNVSNRSHFSDLVKC